MFNTIVKRFRRDGDLPERAWRLAVLRMVLDGRLYDLLDREFHEERTDGKEYIPLRDRRPSVRYPLCRIVVQDAVSLLFSEGHFPDLQCKDEDVRLALLDLVKETRLPSVMTEAAMSGSVGSVAIRMRAMKFRVFFDVLPTEYLTPEWEAEAPDTLARVTERYKVRRAALVDKGYSGLDEKVDWWWFQRRWTQQAEEWFLPWPVGDKDAVPVLDARFTMNHNLGFVPIVWVKNLPGGSSTGDHADGACTFGGGAIDTQIEIEYQLSQAGRGLKYSSDPTLLIKEPAFGEQDQFVRSADNALVVSEKGDAKLLEIGGTAANAVVEYVRALRELALESIRGNRSNADKLSAAQSGRALELMHQSLIWLADQMRQSYGEEALLALVGMVAAVSRQMTLRVKGKPFPAVREDEAVSLKWPPWFQPTGDDLVGQANAIATLRVAGVMSQREGINAIAENYDIEDTAAEAAAIAADHKAVMAGDMIAPTGREHGAPGPNGNRGNGGDRSAITGEK